MISDRYHAHISTQFQDTVCSTFDRVVSRQHHTIIVGSLSLGEGNLCLISLHKTLFRQLRIHVRDISLPQIHSNCLADWRRLLWNAHSQVTVRLFGRTSFQHVCKLQNQTAIWRGLGNM